MELSSKENKHKEDEIEMIKNIVFSTDELLLIHDSLNDIWFLVIKVQQ